VKFDPSNFDFETARAGRSLRTATVDGRPQINRQDAKADIAAVLADGHHYRQYLGRGGSPCGRPLVPTFGIAADAAARRPYPWDCADIAARCPYQIADAAARRPYQRGLPTVKSGFTLIEILVAMTLMTLIVVALMTVFNGTQKVFRAGLTQTDVLESGRETMDLIQSDLATLTPSLGFGTTNGFVNGAVNFCITNDNDYTAGYSPLYQPLPASPDNQQRTNVLESFFILSRGNVNGGDSWIGTGYAVVATNLQKDLYPLYRFTTNYPTMTTDPGQLFYSDALNNFSNNFTSFLQSPTNYSHVMDGVVHLRVYAVDNNGELMNTTVYSNYLALTNFVFYLLDPTLVPDEVGCVFYSNKVPTSVEVEMGVLEDSTLAHAESLGASFQTNYLAQHAGQVHIFRQRVPIRNVDPAAYQ
jgi:prepilin-type N-terminal cleavage/methylation domain-containing protein